MSKNFLALRGHGMRDTRQLLGADGESVVTSRAKHHIGLNESQTETDHYFFMGDFYLTFAFK